jgi:hypothetical protein
MTLKLVHECDGCCGKGYVPRPFPADPEPCEHCNGAGTEEVDAGQLLDLAAALRQIARAVEVIGKGLRVVPTPVSDASPSVLQLVGPDPFTGGRRA